MACLTWTGNYKIHECNWLKSLDRGLGFVSGQASRVV